MCRNIFLIFLWNIFAETKFSELLPNPSLGDFITFNVNRKWGMRKHEKVNFDWFCELKVYFKRTAILAWRMFVTWAFSPNSLHNVALLRWQHSSNTDVITVIVDYYLFVMGSAAMYRIFPFFSMLNQCWIKWGDHESLHMVTEKIACVNGGISERLHTVAFLAKVHRSKLGRLRTTRMKASLLFTTSNSSYLICK